jgi:hypothetical protein
MSTNRMPAHAKVKSPESQLLEGQDVRIPDIFDIGKIRNIRWRKIGKWFQ